MNQENLQSLSRKSFSAMKPSGSQPFEIDRESERDNESDSLIDSGKPPGTQVDNGGKSMYPESSFMWTAIEFAGCFAALQISYLTWGLMQELIMNSTYEPTDINPSGKFPSATFCVFSNRIVAIIVSSTIVRFRFGTWQTAAPLIAYAPCALSNTISSWAQYQALSFVSFSLQTIFKSTKVIPVMLMGTLLKGTKYSMQEVLEAIAITIGVTTFSLSKSSSSGEDISMAKELLGFVLLSTYVLSDSFTSQWQSKLYKDYGKIDSFQMMFGVNVSSIIFTIIALLLSGDIPLVYDFMQRNPSALYYNIITAITSTTGQIAIYYTIKRFGPIAFTIIMTTRQMLSICISNYYFNHPLSFQSYIGLLIVFGTVSYTIYTKATDKKESKPAKVPEVADKDSEKV